jgi:hypothetical protein
MPTKICIPEQATGRKEMNMKTTDHTPIGQHITTTSIQGKEKRHVPLPKHTNV